MLFCRKDLVKLLAISLIVACAVFVCNLFLNYYIDLVEIGDTILPAQKKFYDAIVTTCISVAGISGGSMISLSVVMLIFYVKNYIEAHSKELGTLKALGYGSLTISSKFWIFGLSVLVGAAIGYLASFILMPSFYTSQNDNEFFQVAFSLHFELFIYMGVIPTIMFGLISVFFAYVKLQMPALSLIRGEDKEHKAVKIKDKGNTTFLHDVSKAVLLKRKSFIFFAIFAPFCFAANVQMGMSMNEYSTPTMTSIMIVIGVLLAVLIILLALSSLIKGNTKAIAVMNINGYSFKDCKKAVLDIYRPFGYIGFILGTFYMIGLMSLMVNVVFKDMDVLAYQFNFATFFITLGIFIPLYELTIFYFSKKVSKINIKAVMLDGE